jgi:hypothetical protein
LSVLKKIKFGNFIINALINNEFNKLQKKKLYIYYYNYIQLNIFCQYNDLNKITDDPKVLAISYLVYHSIIISNIKKLLYDCRFFLKIFFRIIYF